MAHENDVQEALGYVAANVRALRLGRGWTQEQLAERAEIQVRHLSDIEHRRRAPSFRLLVVLAALLGVPPARLLRKAVLSEVPRGRPPRRAAAQLSQPGEAADDGAGSDDPDDPSG